MRLLFAFILFSFSFNLNAQVLDFEVINECLIDSTALRGEVKFKRVRVLNTGEIKDYTFDLTAEYIVVGIIKPCDDLEFLDKTCYRLVGGEYCDRGLFNPSNSFNESQVDSVFFDDDIFIPLNYPYLIKTGGGFNQTEYDRYYTDLAAYLDNYGYAYTTFGPGLVVRQTNLVFSRWVRTDFTDNSTSQFSFNASNTTNCITVEESEVYEYRNQKGEVQIIIDDAGNVLSELPTTGLIKINCDLELLEKECYQVIDTLEPVCDYSLNILNVASNPFDPLVSQLIDSVFFEGTFMQLQNYPYEVQGANAEAGRAQLSDDIRNYYVTNNIAFSYILGLKVFGTKGALTRNVGRSILTSGAEGSIEREALQLNCQDNYSSSFYSLYRDITGRVQAISTPDGRIIKNLPPNAVRIECCLICSQVADDACQVRQKTHTIVLTNDVRTFYANTYHSIAIWHTDGAMRYQVDNDEPVDFLENRNFQKSDKSTLDCTYKQSTYTIDTSQFGGGQALIEITY